MIKIMRIIKYIKISAQLTERGIASIITIANVTSKKIN